MRLRTLALILLVLIASLIVGAIIPYALAAPSLTFTPAYKLTVNVANDSGSDITDAFVPLVNPSTSAGMINASGLSSGGYMQADGDDIQFINGPDEWYGSAQDLTDSTSVWWTRITSLADGDTRNQLILLGDSTATLTTIDQGLGVAVAADNVTVTTDPDLNITDDLAFEIKVDLLDTTTVAIGKSFGEKWDANTGYGFLLDAGPQEFTGTIAVEADDYSDDMDGPAYVGFDATTVLYSGFTHLPGSEIMSGYRFTNVCIPNGATISSATLTFQSKTTNDTTTVLTRFYGEAAANPTAPTNHAQQIARTRTTAFVSWDNLPTWNLDADYTSPDLSTIVQEIVNLAAWEPCNAMQFFWQGDAGTNDALRRPKDYGDGNSAILLIDYAIGSTPLIRAKVDTYELNANWDGATATWRGWYTTDGPIFALSKDGEHVDSNSSVSGAVDTNGTSLLFSPGRLAYVRSLRVLSGVGLDYTNLAINPSVETNTTGYVARADSTIAQGDSTSLYGTYSLQVVSAGSDDGDVEGAYFTITSQTSASTTYRGSWYCTGTGTWALRFSDDTGGGGTENFYTQAGVPLTASTWTRLTTSAALNGASTYRRVNVVHTSMGASETVNCDGLQVETGSAAAQTYIDGAQGANIVWGGTAHASVSYKPQAGTEVLSLAFEPADLAQTDPGDAGDGWTWEGTVTDRSASAQTVNYAITYNVTGVSSTIFRFQIESENAYQGTSAEPTPVLPTPVVPSGYASEGTGSGNALYGLIRMVSQAGGYPVTIIWYAATALIVTLVIVVVHGAVRQYWLTLLAGTFVVVVFAAAGAIGWWVLFVYLFFGTAVGLSERISL